MEILIIASAFIVTIIAVVLITLKSVYEKTSIAFNVSLIFFVFLSSANIVFPVIGMIAALPSVVVSVGIIAILFRKELS
jgi:hypothetical protein